MHTCTNKIEVSFEWYGKLKIESIMSFLLITATLPYIIAIFYNDKCMEFLKQFCWKIEDRSNFNEFLPLIGGFDIAVIVFLVPLAFDVYEKIKGKVNLKLIPSNFDKRVKGILVSHSIHLSAIVFNILISNFRPMEIFIPTLNVVLFGGLGSYLDIRHNKR